MASFFALVGLLVATQTNRVLPEEAISTALWFSECVDINKPMQLASVKLERAPIKQYVVKLKISGDRYPVIVAVDAVSGDVIEARHGPYDQDRYVLSEQTDRWIKRLGRDKDTIRNEYEKTYQGTQHGLCFENGIGSQIAFSAPNGIFKSFRGYGSLPQLPDRLRNFSSQQIVEKAIAACKKNPVFDGDTVEGRASKAVLYSPNLKRSLWIWKVELGSSVNDKWTPKMAVSVSDEDGKLLDHSLGEPIPYESREPRTGLTKPTHARVDLGLLDRAIKMQTLLGRTDLPYSDIIFDNGVILKEGEGANWGIDLRLDRHGKLYFFKATATYGLMEPGSCMEKGTRFLRLLTDQLPEGEFVIHPSVTGPYSSVVYRQSAFGYPYLESEVAEVTMNTQGQVVRFEKREPLKRPKSVPKHLLTPDEMKARALQACPPQLFDNTPDITYSPVSKIEGLGWYTSIHEKEVILAYRVMVGTNMTYRVGGRRGWGTIYYFEAETGRKLENIKALTNFEDEPNRR